MPEKSSTFSYVISTFQVCCRSPLLLALSRSLMARFHHHFLSSSPSHHVEHQRRHGQRGPLGPLVGGLLPPSAQGSYRGTLICFLCGAHRNALTTEQESSANKAQKQMHLVICVGSVRRTLVQTGFPAGIFLMDFWVGYVASTERNRPDHPPINWKRLPDRCTTKVTHVVLTFFSSANLCNQFSPINFFPFLQIILMEIE